MRVIIHPMEPVTPETEYTVRPVGVIRTPYRERGDAPRQGLRRPDVEGKIEIFPEFEPGLDGVEKYERLDILFRMNRNAEHSLVARPRGGEERGVFASRSPRHPNLIGLTTVRLVERKGRMLRVAGVDMLDGTPVLDIKPALKE